MSGKASLVACVAAAATGIGVVVAWQILVRPLLRWLLLHRHRHWLAQHHPEAVAVPASQSLFPEWMQRFLAHLTITTTASTLRLAQTLLGVASKSAGKILTITVQILVWMNPVLQRLLWILPGRLLVLVSNGLRTILENALKSDRTKEKQIATDTTSPANAAAAAAVHGDAFPLSVREDATPQGRTTARQLMPPLPLQSCLKAPKPQRRHDDLIHPFLVVAASNTSAGTDNPQQEPEQRRSVSFVQDSTTTTSGEGMNGSTATKNTTRYYNYDASPSQLFSLTTGSDFTPPSSSASNNNNNIATNHNKQSAVQLPVVGNGVAESFAFSNPTTVSRTMPSQPTSTPVRTDRGWTMKGLPPLPTSTATTSTTTASFRRTIATTMQQPLKHSPGHKELLAIQGPLRLKRKQVLEERQQQQQHLDSTDSNSLSQRNSDESHQHHQSDLSASHVSKRPRLASDHRRISLAKYSCLSPSSNTHSHLPCSVLQIQNNTNANNNKRSRAELFLENLSRQPPSQKQRLHANNGPFRTLSTSTKENTPEQVTADQGTPLLLNHVADSETANPVSETRGEKLGATSTLVDFSNLESAKAQAITFGAAVPTQSTPVAASTTQYEPFNNANGSSISSSIIPTFQFGSTTDNTPQPGLVEAPAQFSAVAAGFSTFGASAARTPSLEASGTPHSDLNSSGVSSSVFHFSPNATQHAGPSTLSTESSTPAIQFGTKSVVNEEVLVVAAPAFSIPQFGSAAMNFGAAASQSASMPTARSGSSLRRRTSSVRRATRR